MCLHNYSGVSPPHLPCRHIHSTVAATYLHLSEQDHTEIAAVLSQAGGPRGPVFGLEGVREGTHGRILRRSLSQLHQGPHLEELCHRCGWWAKCT